MTFVFYKVSKKDFNKISLISDVPDEYPIMYSIFDSENVFVKVNHAEPSTILEAYNAVKSYYDDDLVKYQEAKLETKKSDSDAELVAKQSMQSTQSKQSTQPDISEIAAPSMSQAELMEAQQKLMEKILCLETKTKEYNLSLLEDIKQRKKSESLLKNKN